jgi:hypothetical protein
MRSACGVADCRRFGIAAAHKDVEDDVAEWTSFSSASAQAASMAGKSVGEHCGENDDHLTIAIIGPSKFALHAL